MLALGDLCFEGMGALVNRGVRCWHCVKYVFRVYGQLKREFELLALGAMCFEGVGAVAKGV